LHTLIITTITIFLKKKRNIKIPYGWNTKRDPIYIMLNATCIFIMCLRYMCGLFLFTGPIQKETKRKKRQEKLAFGGSFLCIKWVLHLKKIEATTPLSQTTSYNLQPLPKFKLKT